MKRAFVFILTILIFSAGAFAYAEGESITNGGFESGADASGLPNGWSYEAWYEGAELGYAELAAENGGEAAYIWCAEGGNDARLCQSIPVEENSFYRLTCKIKPNGVSGGAGANISVADSLATSVGVYGEGDWREVELVGQTGDGQEELVVCVRVGGYGLLSEGGAWFDDVAVEKLDSYSGDCASFAAASTGGGDDGAASQTEIPGFGFMIAAVAVFALIGTAFYRRFIETDCTNDLSDYAKMDNLSIAAIMLCAFVVRCALSVIFVGHSTDINCFMAWASALAEGGPGAFYTSGMFADYPPGYMYVLWLVGGIGKLFGISSGSASYALLVKLPGIFADIIAAYVVFRIARGRDADEQYREPRSGRLPLALAAAVAFNPVMAFVSGGWGQIDQILSLMLLLVIWLFVEDKKLLAGLVYGVAIMTKPQALMAGPLFAVAYFCYIKDKGAKALLKTIGAVALACAMIFVMSLPFRGSQAPFWFIEKILGTATSYGYASIEAFNLFGLLGGNWADVESKLFLFSYGTWGTIFIALSVAFASILYIKGRKSEKHCLTLCAGYLIAALFMLGQYMHERYLFPALLLLLAAFIMYRDRRLMLAYIWLTCSLLFNVLIAYEIVDYPGARGIVYELATIIGAVSNLGGFAFLTYSVWRIVASKEKLPSFAEKRDAPEECEALPDPVDTKLHYSKRDKLFVAALTLVYCAIAVTNLGTTTAPETYWLGASGDSVEITLEREADISSVRVYGGLYTGTASLTPNGGQPIEYTEDNGDMFRWREIGKDIHASSFTLNVTEGSVWFFEIACFDENGEYIPATASGEAAKLFDEPEEVAESPSYMFGMYFDELYHARTAYEHLNGIEPYENSHPPLGKVFIMLGIAVFGMNPLGWRIVGALFGVAMVPIMYAFGKRLFKKSEYALLAAGLFAFDFMHFTQTRIATIDVYGVFFIILMFYYMYQYYEMNFYVDGLKKTLKPLALGGLFFGFGAASKWICFYAGGGMAVMLFTSLAKRFAEYLKFKDSEDEALRERVRAFVPNTIKTLLLCCVFYIAIPVAIYLASYIPYVLSEAKYDLEGIWGVQEFMFNYHSTLTATHAYQSPWWQWPLIIRPMWYYVNYNVPAGYIGTMSAMGNPAVWWVCGFATVYAAVARIRGKIKPSALWFTLFVALLSNYLPWVLVSRCTFIYHYFASVPFITLIGVAVLKNAEEKEPRLAPVKWIWLGAAIVLFMAFYPIISGVPCSREYVRIMEWLPSWTFLGS